MDKQEAIKELESHRMSGTDIRDFCYNEGINAGITIMRKIGEVDKPVIPNFVAEFVDWVMKRNWAPSDAIREFQDRPLDAVNLPDTLELEKLGKYFEIAYCRYDFERACILGYKVEEPLYHVKITVVNETYYLIQNKTMSGETYTHLSGVKKNKHCRTWKNSFTEQEIKEINADLWTFAIPVREEN
ncbi:hypothetical protein PEf771_100 [Enterococcus phage PEf771]|uniref:DUF1642 domain-containing protein n=1 Tax=Enterococcus phage PEf771 TaxID=2601638 RepID=A0A5C2H0I8_9CAUD|nr:hypothetical protein PEf771_100 [Enterococcus phage PEf771]